MTLFREIFSNAFLSKYFDFAGEPILLYV